METIDSDSDLDALSTQKTKRTITTSVSSSSSSSSSSVESSSDEISFSESSSSSSESSDEEASGNFEDEVRIKNAGRVKRLRLNSWYNEVRFVFSKTQIVACPTTSLWRAIAKILIY